MSGGNETVETTQQLSPEQEQLLGLAIPAVTDISNNTPTLLPGSHVAGFNPNQIAAQNSAINTAGSLDPYISGTINQAGNVAGAGTSAGFQGLGDLIAGGMSGQGMQDFILSGDVMNAGANPYLQGAISSAINPLADNLMETILPGIGRGAGAAGQVGSSRHGLAEAGAIGDFFGQAGDIATNMANTGYNVGLDAVTGQLDSTRNAQQGASNSLLQGGLQSLFAAPELSNLAMMPSQILGAVGGQQQAQSQLQLSDQANQHMLQQMMPFMIAQDVANMAFGIPNGSTTTTSAGGGPDPLSAILSIGSIMAGLPIL